MKGKKQGSSCLQRAGGKLRDTDTKRNVMKANKTRHGGGQLPVQHNPVSEVLSARTALLPPAYTDRRASHATRFAV
ncbi:hypothetical protein E2C01_096517 [Portunus trituberculatus]|uniref:Uncharacterized protein n=1 Tax=Portunus trituberculatus TaxID=210409 RepID=A0A5B7K366_PORTR|nr:hypothetical protein [Portunus trituberculatus]